jgi:YaiO family outer membrane protein
LKRAAAHWIAGGAVALCAAGAAAGPAALEAAASSEQLSGDRSAWRSAELLGLWRDPAGWSTALALRRTERFGLTDHQVEGSASVPLQPGWRAEAELAHSESHRVLPQWRLRTRLWALDVGGWNLAAGAGRTLYRSAGVQGSSVVELQAERYVRDLRFAWVGSLTRLDAGGSGSGGAQQWRLDWYANERASAGVLLAFGRELENQPGRGVIASRVRGAALSGQWRFAPDWTGSAELSTQRVGDLYERSGVRLGLRRQF